MKLARVIAPVAAASVIATGVAAPQASAYTVAVDKETATCTITFTDTDKERVNGAYSGLFLRLAEKTRDGVEGEYRSVYAKFDVKKDFQTVWDWGVREDVKDVRALSSDPEVSVVQARLGTSKFKNSYYQMAGLLNASKQQVIGEQTIEITQEKAHADGGPTYGVKLDEIIAGVFGGLIFGGDTVKLRDDMLDVVKTHAPEFAAPIIGYGTAFSACADGESKTSSIPAGSSMGITDILAIAISTVVVGIISLIGIGFAIRPFVDQLIAQIR